MVEIKVYVQDGQGATITCPSCGGVQQIDASRVRKLGHSQQVRCRCGQQFRVQFEFRRHFRKTVDLMGTYRPLDRPQSEALPMRIHNLSRDGIGFSVDEPHGLEPGQALELIFTLDDRKQSRVEKDAVVMSVCAGVIGCQFKSHGALDRALGFYLQG